MSDVPLTLRQMSGLPDTPPLIDDAVVIVIDAQREYTDGALVLDGVEPALDNIARILQQARAAGSTVIHVAHRGDDDGTFAPGAGGRIVDRVAPVEEEPLVMKSYPNAFNGTELRQLIHDAGDRRLVVCGFMTHMCISATARAALDAGLDATVVADACATRSLPSAVSGAVLDAAVVHELALSELGDLFALVATTDRVLAAAAHLLVDVEWTVASIGGVAVSTSRPPNVMFTSEGSMHGFTGVNRMFGGYQLIGDELTTGQAGSTMMAGPADAMKLEVDFLRAIAAGGRVSVTGRAASIGEGETRLELLAPVAPATLAPDTSDDMAITGSVAYRERIAMPPGAVLTVSLLDVSRADAPADVISKIEVADPGNVPIDFELPYDPAVIDERHEYSVRATITVDDRLWFTSDAVHPVITRGHATTVTIPLVRAGS